MYFPMKRYQKTKKQYAENKEFVKERERLLIQAGFDKDYLDIAPSCPKCEDSGFDGGKLCSCLEKEITAISLKEANLA